MADKGDKRNSWFHSLIQNIPYLSTYENREVGKDVTNGKINERKESGVFDNAIHAVENAVENAAIAAENAAMEVAANAFENISDLSDIVNAFDHLESKVKAKFTDESIHPEIKEDVAIRRSNDLCKEEQEFLKERKEYIKKSFAKYVGVDVKEIDVDDIPVIAFAGSGGGFRAMIANTAYIRATQDSGLYDCGVYFAGVSGGCLSLAQQYSSLHATKDNPIQHLLDDFKDRLSDHIANPLGFLKDLSKSSNYEAAVELSFGGLVEKEHSNLKARVIDTFGSLLSAKLLLEKDKEPQREDFKLSQQRRFLKGGKKMMPIYTAVEAHKVENEKVENEKVKIEKHHDWYEFTPFEIGCDEFDAWIPTWAFGREFKSGKNVNRVPEQNISQLLGMFGSAPCAPFKDYLETFKQVATDGWAKEKFLKLYSEFGVLVGDDTKEKIEEKSIFLPADNHYHGFLNKLRFELLDSGVSNDLPLYPLTFASRKVDVIIAFDSSGTVNNHEDFVKKQEVLASRRKIKIEKRDVESKYCEIYNYSPNGSSDAHPCTMCYVPYLPNDKVKKNFAPCVEYFMTKFRYSEEEIDLMIKLAKQNWLEAAEEKVRNIIIEAWKKKRDARVKN